MKSTKAVLFVIFCLFSVAAIGTSFSHYWRTQSKLSALESNPSLPVNP